MKNIDYLNRLHRMAIRPMLNKTKYKKFFTKEEFEQNYAEIILEAVSYNKLRLILREYEK